MAKPTPFVAPVMTTPKPSLGAGGSAIFPARLFGSTPADVTHRPPRLTVAADDRRRRSADEASGDIF